MSYCLVLIGSTYELVDRDDIDGASCPFTKVDIKRPGGKTDAGMFVNGGTLTQMSAEMEMYQKGEKKITKRNLKPLFSVASPHCSEDEIEEEGQPSASRPMRIARIKKEKNEKTPQQPLKKRKRGNSLPPVVPPLSSTVIPSTTVTSAPAQSGAVTMDAIFNKLLEIQSSVALISSRQDRLEKRIGDITNDVVGTRYESRTLVDVTRKIQTDVKSLATVLEEVKDRVPPPPQGPEYGIYADLTNEKVDEIDNTNDGLLIFAGKLDRALFGKTYVRHQDRDQNKMKWLIEVILHRRRHSIGKEVAKFRSLIYQRINANAKRVEDEVYLERLDQARAQSQPFTPPIHISSSRPTANHSQFDLATTTPSRPNSGRIQTPILASTSSFRSCVSRVPKRPNMISSRIMNEEDPIPPSEYYQDYPDNFDW
ncbi:hypothetical protein PRIPAC_91041 [Pristionchus pacificus]|uniref:Uncharacterized protein n=1 Tax=Pristionchus pacificus TaxID=54126 RepID=A0A454XQK3_PRIPA|nr:hypothetical protein PRIPAC_91041 [Pristionchus pacificus]|eukprot:PDM82991.1 hypothetical protein PRIPAC_37384 [Pristionchus pacificus]